MGFNVVTFHDIDRSLDACSALGLIILLVHYLNSTMLEVSLSEIFAIVLTTISRYITVTFTLGILLLSIHLEA